AMFVGSMMMPEPIMLTATMNVSCTTFIFFRLSAIHASSLTRYRPDFRALVMLCHCSLLTIVLGRMPSRQRGVTFQSHFGKRAARHVLVLLRCLRSLHVP